MADWDLVSQCLHHSSVLIIKDWIKNLLALEQNKWAETSSTISQKSIYQYPLYLNFFPSGQPQTKSRATAVVRKLVSCGL